MSRNLAKINSYEVTGPNKGNYSGHLQINPFIGIHCIPIMKLVDELEGEKYKTGSTATYAIHMGEIAPDVRQFTFTNDTDLEAEAERLADEVITHALPWMKSHANYQILLEIIKNKVDILGGNPQWYAAGLYLNKQTEAALKFVQSRTDLFDSKDHGQYSLYNRFAEPFFNMVSEKRNCDSGVE